MEPRSKVWQPLLRALVFRRGLCERVWEPWPTKKVLGIAHWEGIHYIVVYKITAQQVTIADPALGRQVISRQQFDQQWTGYGLLLEPTDQLQETEVNQASLGRYVKVLLPYRGLIAQIIIVSLLIQCFGLVSPLFTQVILESRGGAKECVNTQCVCLRTFNLWPLGIDNVGGAAVPA